jgi:Tripartite tricarboxylate transporter family receptor
MILDIVQPLTVELYRGRLVLIFVSAQVQVMFADTLTAGAQLKDGRVRALAVATTVRSPTLPDTPTIAETVPGFDASSWWGIGAPRGTPEEIVKTLNAEINAGLVDPKLKARFAEMGALILGGTCGIRQDDRRRDRKVGQGGQVRRRQGGLTGTSPGSERPRRYDCG